VSFTHYTPGLAPDERYDPPLGPRVWAGAILMAASLGFIFLAGCFTLGILVIVNPPGLAGPAGAPAAPAARADLSGQDFAFMLTLYALTGVCVLAAGLLFFLGLTGLVRILMGKTPSN
jgi:hypothetical protein